MSEGIKSVELTDAELAKVTGGTKPAPTPPPAPTTTGHSLLNTDGIAGESSDESHGHSIG